MGSAIASHMQFPFTTEQFFAAFREYIDAVWPAEIVLAGFALCAVGLVFMRRPAWSGPLIPLVLALLRGWLALACHVAFFARVNPLAYALAALSMAGALVLSWRP
jgi:hypothetical protein